MQSKASTVAQYLAELPADRRDAVEAVRKVVKANLDSQYEEGMQYGMIGFYVPHKVFPAGYHCDPKQPLPFAALASQKNYISLYLMGVYCGCAEGPDGVETSHAKWFREAWAKSGKKLDMGRACLKFTKLEELALDVIGEAIRRVPAKTYIEQYQNVLAKTRAERAGKSAAKKGAAASVKSKTVKAKVASSAVVKKKVAKKS